jgi:uncharacterized protein YggE
MKRTLLITLIVISSAATCFAQASGNIGYSQTSGKRLAEQNERNKRLGGQPDAPPSVTSMFVDASVLMNVKADEHVAVFAVNQECKTVPECNQQMDTTVAAFIGEMQRLGVSKDDIFVDFAAQNKIYSYQVAGTVAKENLTGFELKKNVAVHYKDKLLLDKLVVAASKSNIFDLIKVDYIVHDTNSVQNRMMEEAAKVIKQKTGRYEKLFGITLQPPAQVYAERHSMYFPTEMYDSYTAYEAENVSPDYYRERNGYVVQQARKSRTFFFNPLNADGFDQVVNPVVLEPEVQFTLYLKVKYEIEQPKK